MGQEDSSNNDKTNSDTTKIENQETKEQNNCKPEYLKTKLETMKRRIDELKEKVQYEEEILHSTESSLKSAISDDKLSESFSDSKQSLENTTLESENKSGNSLYFSTSNQSLCSFNTSSTDLAQNNFNELVNNFLKDRNQKKRLNILRLHSNKQISLNMMRYSLSELSAQCSQELELIESSLQHLNRLATEFGVPVKNCQIDDCEFKTLDRDDRNTNHKSRKNERLMRLKFKVPGVQTDRNPALTETESEGNISTLEDKIINV